MIFMKTMRTNKLNNALNATCPFYAHAASLKTFY